MKIDFHTHGKLAKKLPFQKNIRTGSSGRHRIRIGRTLPDRAFQHAGLSGGVPIYIWPVYKRRRFSCDRERIPHLSGMETDIAEGGHTLIIGPMECILEMNQRLEPNKEKGKFLTFEKLAELVKSIRSYSVLDIRTETAGIYRSCHRKCWRNSSFSM